MCFCVIAAGCGSCIERQYGNTELIPNPIRGVSGWVLSVLGKMDVNLGDLVE